MKKVVSGHALALHTIMIDGACGPVELQVYEGENGSYVAIDGSWLEQVAPEEGPVYIADPYNEGMAVQLIEKMEEKVDTTVAGEADEQLIMDVINNIQKDLAAGDLTAIAEMLAFTPKDVLKGYLPENI